MRTELVPKTGTGVSSFLSYTPDLEYPIGGSAHFDVESIMAEYSSRHSWYVGLVVRSKLQEVLTGWETDEEIAAMLTPVKEPGFDGWNWLLYGEIRLIGWRHPMSFRMDDAGRHLFTYVEYQV